VARRVAAPGPARQYERMSPNLRWLALVGLLLATARPCGAQVADAGFLPAPNIPVTYLSGAVRFGADATTTALRLDVWRGAWDVGLGAGHVDRSGAADAVAGSVAVQRTLREADPCLAFQCLGLQAHTGVTARRSDGATAVEVPVGAGVVLSVSPLFVTGHLWLSGGAVVTDAGGGRPALEGMAGVGLRASLGDYLTGLGLHGHGGFRGDERWTGEAGLHYVFRGR